VYPSRKADIWQLLLLTATILCAAGSLFFWFLYFTLYWPYRNLFNEEGRYFDEDSVVVYHEQNGLMIVPALALLLLAVLFGSRWWARRRAVHAGGP
jgi:NADH:ubiquinone oxidoreductase subunit 5 (subunit L)/multisubunit Na+/H+ antiporter MnhA subunit